MLDRLPSPRTSAVLLLCASISACLDPTIDEQLDEVPWTEAGEQLAQQLHGTWTVMSTQSNDCPPEFITQPMQGTIRWTANAHRASLTPLSTPNTTLDFYASNAHRLERKHSLKIEDCIVAEVSTIDIDELSASYASGSYQAHYTHNNGQTCQLVAEDQTLPKECTVTVSWQAARN